MLFVIFIEQAKMDKSDELRLLPLSMSWYHADVLKIMSPLFDNNVPAEFVLYSSENMRPLRIQLAELQWWYLAGLIIPPMPRLHLQALRIQFSRFTV
jgi:hypothetical protein